jgi:hypothetical protein
MGTALQRRERKDWSIMGVDKFEDRFCEDWPENKRELTWDQASFGEAPALKAAQRNLETLGLADRVRLVQQRAEDFQTSSDQKFDFIYIDTSHDYETTRNTIKLALPRLRPNGLPAGDDCSNEGTWGVKRAVREAFKNPTVVGGWLWWARGMECRL